MLLKIFGLFLVAQQNKQCRNVKYIHSWRKASWTQIHERWIPNISSSAACRRICDSLPGVIKYTVYEVVKSGAGSALGIAALLKPTALKVLKRRTALQCQTAFWLIGLKTPISPHIPDLKWIQSNKQSWFSSQQRHIPCQHPSQQCIYSEQGMQLQPAHLCAFIHETRLKEVVHSFR